jgi:hypothetical protein
MSDIGDLASPFWWEMTALATQKNLELSSNAKLYSAPKAQRTSATEYEISHQSGPVGIETHKVTKIPNNTKSTLKYSRYT